MKKRRVKKLARQLEKHRQIAFMHSGSLYVMWWSADGDGWYIEVYDPFNLEVEDDGGLCTSTKARDAIEFML